MKTEAQSRIKVSNGAQRSNELNIKGLCQSFQRRRSKAESKISNIHTRYIIAN